MKYLIMTIMLAMSTVNAGENVASAIDEYIDDNPEVVLPILVGGGVSTAGVILTIGAMAGAVMLPEAVIPVALGAGILGTSMAVGGSLSIFVGTGIGVARAVDGIFN
jgi:hypothetical protein